MIGLQQPHTVTFSVPNGQGGTTTKVWHGDKLGDVIPTVTADKGYRFTGNWTVGAKTYTADQLKKETISSDVTVKAEVKQLYSLTYDLNGGSGAAAPATSTHIEGEKVSLDYTGTENLKKGEKTIFAAGVKRRSRILFRKTRSRTTSTRLSRMMSTKCPTIMSPSMPSTRWTATATAIRITTIMPSMSAITATTATIRTLSALTTMW